MKRIGRPVHQEVMELRPEAAPVVLGSAQVLERVRARDADAMAELVAAHDGEMVRLCFVISGDREIARDATQSAWQKLWQKPPRLRDDSRLRSWLLSVAANEARHAVRRRGRGRVKEIEAFREPGGYGLATDVRIDLRSALQKLTPEERELIGLRYLVGLTSSEIGAQLGLTPEGARSRLHRVLARLREELDR